MTRLARVAFGLLVVATFSAFFVAQRLKSAPAVIDVGRIPKFFSPNADGERDVEEVSFRVKSRDDVTVDVVDAGGGRVRRLAGNRRAEPFTPVRLRWDGRTDEAARAPDGRYRLRVALRRTGRSVVVPDPIELDTTPPRPEIVRVRSVGAPAAPRGPAVVRPGEPVQVTVRRVSRFRRTQFAVWRTDERPARSVATFESRRKGSRRGIWDGRVDGRPAVPGTYLIVPEVEDRAGNEGTAPATLPPEPGTVPGRPGVLVRELAVQAPLRPVRAGARASFLVDSRGRSYRWNVRRVGAARRVRKGSARPGRPLTLRAPGGVSGLYLLEVRSGSRSTRVPFLVQSTRRARILVVLPAIGWLGGDPVDDDGDGLPNTLALGEPVRVPRPLTGLPASVARESAPLLAFLDRARVRYDVTTDLALAATDDDPSPTDRQGVLLPEPLRHVPRALAGRLRRYVERGGRLATFGTGTLRRGVTLAARGRRLERPTQPTATDAFGVRLRDVRRVEGGGAELTTLDDDPAVGLLEGFGGALDAFRTLEESADGGRSRVVAGVGQEQGADAPVDPETNAPRAPAPALSASRLGRGLLIRVGLPEWSRRLGEDGDVQQITRNALDLLRRVRPRPRSPLR